jgi:hypothetical protein
MATREQLVDMYIFYIPAFLDISGQCWWFRRLKERKRRFEHVPSYFVFTESELLFLIICIFLDISEYMIAILLLPSVGDLLDIIGIIASLVMFRWVGIISLFELIPGADIFPIFIITWLVWYSLKTKKR